MSVAPKVVGVEPPELDVGIGDGRIGTAEVVGGGTGFGAGAVRPDADLTERVDAGDRTAAGTDLDHLDDRDRDGHAAALLEAGGAGDLERLGRLRRVVLDQAILAVVPPMS